MNVSPNLRVLSIALIVGGFLLWIIDLLLLNSTDFGTSQVVIAALGTMAVVLPAVMVVGVIALVVGAAMADRNEAEWVVVQVEDAAEPAQ